jgi:hypothetical protein
MYANPVDISPVFDAFKKLLQMYSTYRVANFSTFHKKLDREFGVV